jgi:hypothetical protein
MEGSREYIVETNRAVGDNIKQASYRVAAPV